MYGYVVPVHVTGETRRVAWSGGRPAAPVFADAQDEFEACKAMKWSEGKKDKKNCFQNLAEMLLVEYKYASQDKSSCAQYCKLIVK